MESLNLLGTEMPYELNAEPADYCCRSAATNGKPSLGSLAAKDKPLPAFNLACGAHHRVIWIMSTGMMFMANFEHKGSQF